MRLDDLDPARADLARRTLAWCDRWWDDDIGLWWNPPEPGQLAQPTVHLLPHSVWYGLGLLLRDRTGDTERAVRLLTTVCDHQYDEPGQVWHGTFTLVHEAPHPQPGARMWTDYDPNWRQFIATAFLLGEATFCDRLPAPLVARMDAAVTLAVEGEPPDRVPANYANIALKKAWLEVEVGHRDGDAALVARGEDLAREVVAGYDTHGALEEYNSPTYYGIDLYALALWRSHSSSPLLRDEGARLEAALWRDLARWYHPGLRNVAGPYTRSYGMDLRTYLATVGLWVWAALGADRAPVPDLDGPFGHAMDVAFGPVVALLGPRIPADVSDRFARFRGEHVVEQRIAGDRVATGWLADRVMIGAETSGIDWSWWDQFHQATIHWAQPDGTVGWLRIRPPAAAEAVAEPGRLRLAWDATTDTGPATVTVHATGADPKACAGTTWRLPGYVIDLATDGSPPEVTDTPNGTDGPTVLLGGRPGGGRTTVTLSVRPDDD
ncbi:hypothetical protein BH24ACT3_BH24ACT3_12350 [soil metagenome]